ncbi:glycosyltransferase family 4 protein [Flavobacterium sp. AS60]|uniref:glycosyltransferase family 4 protein n=1 Tax=Flavobacterium anseongense TaxID=2910677 RepID=UPI001F3D1C50|nr:glycosyltransferase family 4 protein [Flavobacterium sp. AS60]MCF6129777.1 glycosyltransferase family 4 protein [Flavobacterium sp. AS60]
MINILFIHQSSDLYGSDKTLLLLLKNLDKSRFNPIVIIPHEGPLKEELEKQNIKVIVAPVLKLYRKMFTPTNLFKFLKEIRSGVATLDDLNEKYQFDLIYSNTLAVLLGHFYTRKRKIKHLWHVHEIIESPKIFTRLFCRLLQSSATTKIVYNSISTQNFWNVNSKIASKSRVIWNGLEFPKNSASVDEITTIRETFFKSKPNEIVIALIGRISRWKGQQLLLNVFNTLSNKHQNIKLVFIGSPPPNQDGFLEDLKWDIQKYQLADRVLVIPFQKEIFKFWQSIDIAVVPSIEPEPFGLVAVEAMLAKKPVIGSNHGGLTEIIINNETGILVEPNNKNYLAEAISKLIENQELREKFGKNGYNRAIKEFSIEKYVQSFEKLFVEL